MAHGGREDCWSEGATASLVDAWGERFLELSRGNLRQKDWKDVADAVNSRQESLGKPTKTDVQCKNRIDTLKKKYKTEKTKPGASQWPLFARLDMLVGSVPVKKQPPPPQAAEILRRKTPWAFATKPRNPNPNIPNNVLFYGGSLSRSLTNSAGSSGSSGGLNGFNGDEDDEVDDIGGVGAVNNFNSKFLDGARSGKRRWEGLAGSSDGGGQGEFGELANAIVKFAEVYERVESSKQQQLMELEKKRMEFAKDMEFQRMQMFMEAQLELEKLKRPKYTSGSAKRLH